MSEQYEVVISDEADKYDIVVDNAAPGATGPQGEPGPNVVTPETQTNISGVLVGDGSTVRPATADEVVSASAMQTAVTAAVVDSRADVLARVVNPGVEGVEWNNGGRVQFSKGSVFLTPDGRKIVSPIGSEYLIPHG